MFDISTRRKIFNLTYYDYSTHAHASKPQHRPLTPTTTKLNNDGKTNAEDDLGVRVYPYYHFTSSSDGTLVTLDKKTGSKNIFKPIDF